MLRSDERFEITAIARDGQSVEPIRTKDAFAAQCGVLVRDKIPISIQHGISLRRKTLRCLMSMICRKMIFGLS